jgi:hypothetical protein
VGCVGVWGVAGSWGGWVGDASKSTAKCSVLQHVHHLRCSMYDTYHMF